MGWESVRECGRQVNRSHVAILNAIKDGRVPAEAVRRAPDGRITEVDVELVAASLRLNTDPTQAGRWGGELPLLARAPAPAPAAAPAANVANMPASSAPGEVGGVPQEPPGDAPEAAAQSGDPHGYYAARASREQFQAKQAQLAYLESIGKLVSAEEVEKEAFDSARTLREQLLNVPDRVATVLAAEPDPVRVHEALTNEIKRVLHEFTGRLAAGGAAAGPA